MLPASLLRASQTTSLTAEQRKRFWWRQCRLVSNNLVFSKRNICVLKKIVLLKRVLSLYVCRISSPSVTGSRHVYQTTYQGSSQKTWLWQSSQLSKIVCFTLLCEQCKVLQSASSKKQILLYLLWGVCCTGEREKNLYNNRENTSVGYQHWCMKTSPGLKTALLKCAFLP